jgi:MFS family permease
VYAGTIAGGWAGAWFAEHYGWRSGFYAFGTVGMVLALVLYRFLDEPRRGAADAKPARELLSLRETVRAVFAAPAVPLLMLAFVGANFVATIFLTWTPTFLVEKFQFTLTGAGLTGAAYIHAASAAAVPVAGLLADRLALRFAGGRKVVQAIGLAGGSAFVVAVGRTESIGMLLFAMTAFGVCKGFYDSGIFASLYDHIEPRARGTAAGLMNTVGWLGGALGPLFVGLACAYGSGADDIENMSNAIAFGGAVYAVAGVLVTAAMLWPSRRILVGSETDSQGS